LTGTLELRIGPRPLTCTTQGWQKAEAREQARELAEEWRLRYVATARARDHLLIPLLSYPGGDANDQREDDKERNSGERGSSFLSLPDVTGNSRVYTYRIDPATIQQAVPRVPMTPPIIQVPTSPAALQTYERWQAERQSLLLKGRGQTSSDSASQVSPSGGFGILPLEKGEIGEISPTASSQVTGGASRKLHDAFLQCVKKQLLHPEHSAHDVVQRLVTGAKKDDLVWLLTTLHATPLFAEVVAAQERVVGLPFTLRYEGQLVTGAIDLAWLTNDRWTVVGCLTDELEIGYEQLQEDSAKKKLYVSAFALERLTGRRIQEIVLFWACSGQVVTTVWTENERQQSAALCVRPGK